MPLVMAEQPPLIQRPWTGKRPLLFRLVTPDTTTPYRSVVFVQGGVLPLDILPQVQLTHFTKPQCNRSSSYFPLANWKIQAAVRVAEVSIDPVSGQTTLISVLQQMRPAQLLEVALDIRITEHILQSACGSLSVFAVVETQL